MSLFNLFFLGSYLCCLSYAATGKAGQANENYPQLTVALHEKVAVLCCALCSSAGCSATMAAKASEGPAQGVGSEDNKALSQSAGNPSALFPGTGEGRA